jgi:hypothetical protein
MNKLLRYKWRWHTMMLLNGKNVKILENEIVEVPENETKIFLSNWFVLVGANSIEILNTRIEEKKEEIKKIEKDFKDSEKTILDSAKNQVAKIKIWFDEKINVYQNQIKELGLEIEKAKEDERLIKEMKNKEIEKLKKEVK